MIPAFAIIAEGGRDSPCFNLSQEESVGNLLQGQVVDRKSPRASVLAWQQRTRGLGTGNSQRRSLPARGIELVTVSRAQDASHLTAKRYSFRLPVHVAAKLAALEKLDPTRSRTQLLGDLLSAAISEVEKNLDSFPGAFSGEMDPETDEEMFYETGPLADYRRIVNQCFQDLEKELGNRHPALLFGGEYLVGADRR